MSQTMTKRKRDQRIIVNTDERIVPAETEAKVEGETTVAMSIAEIIGRYVPPPCSACSSMSLPNRRTTYVNGTQIVNTQTEFIIERSIKCPNCGTARMDYERIPHAILNQGSTAAE